MVITAQGTLFPGTLSSLGTRRAYSSSTIISRADGQMVPTDYGATTQHATSDVHEVMRAAAVRLAAAAINCDDAAHDLQKKRKGCGWGLRLQQCLSPLLPQWFIQCPDGIWQVGYEPEVTLVIFTPHSEGDSVPSGG